MRDDRGSRRQQRISTPAWGVEVKLVVAALAVLSWLSAAQAQSQQPGYSTSGVSSPIVANNHGTTTVINGVVNGPLTVNGPLSLGVGQQLQADLFKKSDPLSKALRIAIERGEFSKARSLIDSNIARLQSESERVAFLNYARAVLRLIDRRPLDAEPSMRVATTLQPANCTYLSLEAIVLVNLNRLAEAASLTSNARPETAACMRDGDLVSRAMIEYTLVTLAMDHGDAPLARIEAQQVDALVESLSKHPDPQRLAFQADAICSFPVVLDAFDEADRKELAKHGHARCQEQIRRFDRKSAADILTLDRQDNFVRKDSSRQSYEEQDVIYSRAIAAASDLKALPDVGFDEDWRAIRLANLYSDRAFQRIWHLKEVEQAGTDLSAAYRTIKPLLRSERPIAWSSFGFIATRAQTYISVYPKAPLDGVSLKSIRDDLLSLATVHPVPPSMDMCEAFDRLIGLARAVDVPSTGLAASLIERRRQCLDAMIDKSTRRFLIQEYRTSLIDADEAIGRTDNASAIDALSAAIDTAHALYGFPLEFEKRYDVYERVIERARLHRLSDEFSLAESDYREALRWAVENNDKVYLPTIQRELASDIVAGRWPGGKDESVELAKESAAGEITALKAESNLTCWRLATHLEALEISSVLAMNSNSTRQFNSALEEMERLGDLVPTCIAEEPVVHLRSKEFSRDRMTAQGYIIQAHLVKGLIDDVADDRELWATLTQRQDRVAYKMRDFVDEVEVSITKDSTPLYFAIVTFAGLDPANFTVDSHKGSVTATGTKQ